MYRVTRECQKAGRASGYAAGMPVIVVGADTTIGTAAVDELAGRVGELRAFVTDPDHGESLKARGVKVAIGDVSDGSHVGGAALRAFCAVLIGEAAGDARERSFAGTPQAVVAAWADGLRDAGVQRIIWVGDSSMPAALDLLAGAAGEVFAVATDDTNPEDAATEIARLEAQP